MSEALDARVEAVIAILSALVFIAILLAGAAMTSDGFEGEGAYVVVAAIVAFILVMAGVGYWISTKEVASEDDDESDDDTEADE